MTSAPDRFFMLTTLEEALISSDYLISSSFGSLKIFDNVHMQFGVCQARIGIVTLIKSYKHFNCLTFPFLAGTKLHVHGVN